MSDPVSGIPDDFQAFWQVTEEQARKAPLRFCRERQSRQSLPGFSLDEIEFDGLDGRRLYGWFAYPMGLGPSPAFLWIPPYGRESMLPNAYGTRPGFASLSLNLHHLGAFHQEKYSPERGYFADGVGSPESWVFRRMFQDLVLAARVLQDQTEVDGDRIGAVGMSQGGGMAIWLGAWCQLVKTVCADMPFLARIVKTLQKPVYRYPLKELTDHMASDRAEIQHVMATLAYYDTVNHAGWCQRPTQVSLGLRDPAARPEDVRAVFDAVRGPKLLRSYDCGHDWFEPMIGNNRQWLSENLR
jgi:cephalosporin-C deacetylase